MSEHFAVRLRLIKYFGVDGVNKLKTESEKVAEEFFQLFKNDKVGNENHSENNSAIDKFYIEKDVESYKKLMQTGIVDDLLAM